MEFFFPWEIQLILKMQEMDDCLASIQKFFTFLGNPEAYLLFIAIIYWSFDRKLGLRLAVFLPVVVSLNGILKQAFHAPRPYWVSPDIEAIKVSNGFGLPSGHAQASTIYLYAAASMKKGWFSLLAIAVTFMVGWSRVHLGVHFPNQVLLGWLLGIGVLGLFYCYEKQVIAWFLRKSFVMQILWLVGLTFLILILGMLFVHLLKDWTFPPDWISNSSDDLACKGESIHSSKGLGKIAGSAGGFLGVTLGGLLSHRKGGFDAGGRICKRICRSFMGILLSAALFAIIWAVRPNETSVKSERTLELLLAIWYFFGLFLISLFIFYLLPLLFRQMKLLPEDPGPG